MHPTTKPPPTFSTTWMFGRCNPFPFRRLLPSATVLLIAWVTVPISLAQQRSNQAATDETKSVSPSSEAPTQIAGQTLPEVVALLSSDNRIVRLRAVRSLRPFGDPAASALIQTLGHEDPGMRYLAAETLGDLSSDVRKPAIMTLQQMADHDSSSAVQMAAAYALCRSVMTSDYLDILIERTSHPERGMVCSAAMLIGKLGADAKRAIKPLQEVYENHRPGSSGDYHKGGAAKNALRKLGAIQ